MLSQHNPVDEITSYLRKTHYNIHSVWYTQGSGQCLVNTASMTDGKLCIKNSIRIMVRSAEISEKIPCQCHFSSINSDVFVID